MAPEAENNLPYNEKVDIFSFGVILRLLLSGVAAAPPQGEGEEDTVTDIDGPIIHSSSSSRISVIDPPEHGVLVTTAMQLLIGTITIVFIVKQTHSYIHACIHTWLQCVHLSFMNHIHVIHTYIHTYMHCSSIIFT